MRVFVTGTGRCGTVSFHYACGPIRNFTNGHETPCGLLIYPDQHIEVNPHLWPCIPALAVRYPDARFVHLIRERHACARSLARLDHGEIMRAHAKLRPSTVPNFAVDDIAYRVYDETIAIINALLSAHVPPQNQRVFRLESIKADWRSFWDWIGAEGDFAASLAEWDVIRNSGKDRGEA